MASRVKPGIEEALSVWADPYDAMTLLTDIAGRVKAMSAQVGLQVLQPQEALKPLGLKRAVELAALAAQWPDMGVVKSGGAWCLDARQFGLWAEARVSVLRRRCGGQPSAPAPQSRALY
ncbi:hypothetical protein BLEM_0596 [Bifidobacterium lemurum]|uniref:Uncharacterized protein n=1 Tax=Bifidobacterium lemurum TaxID=1603886 RepID=A0A261FU17_9BIFI|nr:hypothetical protein [Bifidobacterium lemurum]OZG62679.1 hypothetical protein BLEM_0596 [Bifidobacterium lemurum]QOL34604.1 hypothetical protein BL8807_01320 [Bifidobacterium lemurum]